jgi:nucleoid-associated protein YgaU
MKKLIVVLFLALVCVAGIFAQSLQDNEFYKKSLEFTRLAEKALDDGDYDAARDYALKAQENAALSKEYIDGMVAAYRARTALNAARARIGLADRYNMKTRNPDVYNSATALYKKAEQEFAAKDYAQCLADAQKVLDLLKEFDAVAGVGAPAKQQGQPGQKVARYVVKLNPALRDCLWRIAGFDFVYGDPTKWRHIYEANKASFPQPNNPALIVPGQVLTIPPLSGETRSGEK